MAIARLSPGYQAAKKLREGLVEMNFMRCSSFVEPLAPLPKGLRSRTLM